MHHANLYVDRARSARQQGDGFPGMDPIIERSIFEPDDGRFLYWKPGNIPYSEPDGLSWRLDPGNDLVLNAHMQPDGKPERFIRRSGSTLPTNPDQLPDAGATGARRRSQHSSRQFQLV